MANDIVDVQGRIAAVLSQNFGGDTDKGREGSRQLFRAADVEGLTTDSKRLNAFMSGAAQIGFVKGSDFDPRMLATTFARLKGFGLGFDDNAVRDLGSMQDELRGSTGDAFRSFMSDSTRSDLNGVSQARMQAAGLRDGSSNITNGAAMYKNPVDYIISDIKPAVEKSMKRTVESFGSDDAGRTNAVRNALYDIGYLQKSSQLPLTVLTKLDELMRDRDNSKQVRTDPESVSQMHRLSIAQSLDAIQQKWSDAAFSALGESGTGVIKNFLGSIAEGLQSTEKSRLSPIRALGIGAVGAAAWTLSNPGHAALIAAGGRLMMAAGALRAAAASLAAGGRLGAAAGGLWGRVRGGMGGTMRNIGLGLVGMLGIDLLTSAFTTEITDQMSTAEQAAAQAHNDMMAKVNSIGQLALTGGMFGMMFGPLGGAIGTVIGGAIGAAMEFKDQIGSFISGAVNKLLGIDKADAAVDKDGKALSPLEQQSRRLKKAHDEDRAKEQALKSLSGGTDGLKRMIARQIAENDAHAAGDSYAKTSGPSLRSDIRGGRRNAPGYSPIADRFMPQGPITADAITIKGTEIQFPGPTPPVMQGFNPRGGVASTGVAGTSQINYAPPVGAPSLDPFQAFNVGIDMSSVGAGVPIDTSALDGAGSQMGSAAAAAINPSSIGATIGAAAAAQISAATAQVTISVQNSGSTGPSGRTGDTGANTGQFTGHGN